ncbi:MAG: cysteine desulfurase family protein [Planctomycetota bacterium]|jgi:cysteine desulfurase
MSIYLDNNATTQPASQVVDAMTESLTTHWHNPSSYHRPGQEARHLVERARAQVATLLGTNPKHITLTSGGTESVQTAIRAIVESVPHDVPATVVTTRIEHSAARLTLEHLQRVRPNLRVEYLPLTDDGLIDTEQTDVITPQTTLVCTHWANNETGAIQPVDKIGNRCRALGVPCMIDATQHVGKYSVSLDQEPIDILICSAHKLHGPKGIGALVTRRGLRLRPLQLGSQESGRRGGTENVPGIVGFGAACEVAGQWLESPEFAVEQRALRDTLEGTLLNDIPDARLNTPRDETRRLWNTINIGFAGVQSEALLMLLSEQGVCASAGAACSSGSLEPSPILAAIGVPESHALGSIRLSLSRHTPHNEIARAQEIIPRCVMQLRGSTRSALSS